MRDWWLPRLTVRCLLLVPLAVLFGCAAIVRRALYRSGVLAAQRLPVPVIVVGNLTIGGSGKTPLVIALVKALREQGWRPGVISRGYGRNNTEPTGSVEVTLESAPTNSGDEPLLIARAARVPVFVDADRARAGRTLLAAYPEVNVIISDDGLQHYALARDIEIAVFDERGAGNGCLLPVGPLREPLARAATLTALVVNDSGGIAAKNSLHQRFPAMHQMKLVPQLCYRLSNQADTSTLAALAARAPHGRIAAMAGIGNPARFFAALRAGSLGVKGLGDGTANVSDVAVNHGPSFTEHVFPDHHAYTRADLTAINADILIITEKDALKCASFDDDRVWVLPVTAQVDGALIELILEKLRGRQAA